MSGIKLYHQIGFRDRWSIDSFAKDGCGDGLILSPVHQPRDQVEELPDSIKANALFDPQYYLPNSPKKKLASYEFFPEQATGGFSTKDFSLVALESAAQCVQFQLDQGFQGVIIPARFFDQMIPKYFEKQEQGTVVPFLTAIEKAGTSKDVYLTLPVTAAMLIDADFRVQLLNWATGFPQITGVYVLVADDRPSKQIRSADLVAAYLCFAQEIRNSGLKPILSHLNTECVLLSLIDGATLTFGAYENTRIFSLDKFIDSDEERRPPKARIYLPGLLNWVQFDQAMQIREGMPDLWTEIYRPTKFGDSVIDAEGEPHFSQPGLYKHYFACMSAQIKALAKLPVQKRYEQLRRSIAAALEFNAQIEEMPIDFDAHGRGTHLEPWLDGLNRFYLQFLKA